MVAMTTPDDSTADTGALTASRETDARVLHVAQGWRWMRRLACGHCSFFPPPESEWERVNFAPTSWRDEPLWPSDEERFTDWTKGGMRRHDNGIEFMPSPSSDEGTALRAFETWLRAHGLSGFVGIGSGGWPTVMLMVGPDGVMAFWAETVCLAICRALLNTEAVLAQH